jgi:hypothetical protein
LLEVRITKVEKCARPKESSELDIIDQEPEVQIHRPVTPKEFVKIYEEWNR